MERKIGETFEFEGKTYKVEEGVGCRLCDLFYECFKRDNKFRKGIVGECSGDNRSDNTYVFFKEIKNMEIKDNKIIIDIPDGMEIDLQDSNFDTGVIKFKKKDITYKDIQDSVGRYPTSDYVTSQNRFKLHAIDMLMNIAKYYNKDWKPDWSNCEEPKHYIVFELDSNSYSVTFRYGISNNIVYFKNKEDAQEVINNQNFRKILDTIFKN